MKLTKQLEKEIRQVYEAYWVSLLSADLKGYAAVLDDDFRLIGTTEAECFFTKKEAVQFLEATAEQVAGNIEIRNRIIKLEPVDGVILITEQCDAYVLIGGEWAFYARTRSTSLLQKKEDGWKFVQQHISFPDNRTQEGETIALEQIKTENLQLRDAVKRRTIELENKNRELEIEAALEWVRAIAMGMNKPGDMLDVCRIIAEQLDLLKVKEIRNVQTAIIYEGKGTYLNYEYYAKHNKLLTTEVFFKNHQLQEKFANQMLTGAEELFTESIKGNELKKWYAYQKTTNQFVDVYLEKARSLNYYWYSLGPVALGISTYAPLTEEEVNLFKRFRNVFELAYRRFIDIERAIAQAKEARIETALERVRAVALGMKKPEDLSDVCEVLFVELRSLGFSEMRNTMINIHNDEKESFLNYDYSDEIGKSITPLFYNIHPVIEKQIKQIRSARDAFSETVFTGKDLESWKEFRKRSGEKDDPRINDISALHYYFYSIGTGSIGISTFSSIGEEKLEALKRFRNVFDFAYRRYMDVAQAEAQAKEARIETALERVRAVAMAMRKPEDLSGIGETLFKELKALGFVDLRNAEIIMNNDAKESITSYYYSDYGVTGIIEVFYNNHPTVKAWAEELKKANDAFAEIVIAEHEMDAWRKYREEIGYVPDPKLDGARTLYYYSYSIGLGALSISSFKAVSAEQVKALERFRNVFNLSYQRYRDISLAEAQAREAKIEAALERVRSKAMAMHKSDDLSFAVAVIFEELDKLNLGMLRCGIGILNKEKRSADVWTTSISDQGKTVQVSGDESMDIHPLLQGAFDAWLRQEDFSYVLEGRDLNEYYRALTQVNFKLPESQSLVSEGEGLQQYYHVATFQAGGLFAFREAAFPEEAKTVMKRFAGVFNLTYSRFLDLQKAEAQAREAQIELALERVRARTMAMQKSEELAETAHVLFEQFKELDKAPKMLTIGIMKEDEGLIEFWVTDWSGGGSKVNRKFNASIDEPILLNKIFAAWKEQRKSTIIELAGKELQDWINYRVSLSGIPDDNDYSSSRGFVIAAFFSKGILSISAYEPRPPETVQLLERFAGVFDGTYTRFLDLQKAEAQAREANIEMALEKVRSRTMGMQKSEELKEVIQVVYEQFVHLNILIEHTGFIMDYKARDDMYIWLADKHAVPFHVTIPYFDCAHWNSFNEAKEKGTDFFANHLTFEEKNRFYQDLFQLIPGVPEETKEYYFSCPGLAISTVLLENIGLYIENFSGIPYTDEENNTLMRFGKVFQQTYTRFRDLKKAEAQTREATIEASLEKVRGKAMAMHTSSDISETTGVIFSELPKLGISSLRCGVALFSKDTRRVIFYAAANALESDSLTLIGTGEMSGHPEFENQYECWLKQENYFVTLSDEALRSYYEALAARLSAPYTPREHREQTEHGYYFPFSAGNFYAWSEKPYSESEIDILQRFKTIIDLTFRRYLDLQKAEAQARESQIEASLERVRSRTLAMQKSDELAETAAVLFKQLITLGIEPNRLYIAIIEDENGNAEFWITDEDGSKVSSGFAANLHGNGSFQKMFEGWQDGKKSITIDMQGKELQEYFQHLSSLSVPFKGGLSQTRRVQNIAYFSRGFIGIASPDKQPEETTTLLERFAAVFNLTLTRFNDLKLAEAQAHQAHLDLIQLQTEKRRAEDALSELRTTQEQLVQQEKLASLGQLTAGIAHEIKNPLNFVNNFSSVSIELVDEAMEEMRNSAPELYKGEIAQLLTDVKANLTKIIEHGTRADGIVKSMLQHSRGASGKMEPTDLKALIKEYVNLAFHGMRAGKNPINVKMELDLDESIGNVPLISEDFSRVIINLCQNAFDAMREKVNSGDSKERSYLPTLTVRTRRATNRITIQIEDNGPGIADAIRDKVLQPFFTTKKGTQGTGLGLSITHDIVKAHGGEMNIETNHDGGATFIIGLPAEAQK